MRERMSDPTLSPTLSDPDSDITELADERHYGKVEVEEEELEDLDDEIFLEDLGSELGREEEEEGVREHCPGANDGQDPFYDRWPLFSLVGRLVRFQEHAVRGN